MTVSGTGSYQIDDRFIFVGNYSMGAAGTATIDGTGGGLTDLFEIVAVGTGTGTGTLTLIGGPSPVDISVGDISNGTDFNQQFAEVVAGRNGTGTINIESGARITSTNIAGYNADTMNTTGGYGNVTIGRQTGSVGIVNVTDAGSFLGAYGTASRIAVGRDNATGTLNIENGGSIGTLNLQIGRDVGGVGTVNVDGTGSIANVGSANYGTYGTFNGTDFSGSAGGLQVGRNGGTGTLNITAGGAVNLANTPGQTNGTFANIGRDAGSVGAILVSGSDSELSFTQDGAGNNTSVTVGREGRGTLTVEDGGVLNVNGLNGGGARVFVGHEVNGPGDNVQNLLEIRSGGVVDVSSDSEAFVIVGEANRTGLITVDNVGSELLIDGGFLALGRGGTGELSITDGGRVVVDNGATSDPVTGEVSGGYYSINIARAGGTGTVTVNGDESLLTAYGLTSRINIGRDAGSNGTLNVLNGGDVATFGLLVGRDGATGVISIDGVGSSILLSDQFGSYGGFTGATQTGGLTLGRGDGEGTLNITNGGMLSLANTDGVTAEPFVNIARNLDSTGTVLVSGAGSQFNVLQSGRGDDGSGPLLGVGRSGQGTLTIDSGGAVLVAGENARLDLGNVHQSETTVTAAENLLQIESGGVVNITSGGLGNAGLRIGVTTGGNSRVSVDGAGSQINVVSGADPDSTIVDGAFITVGRQGDGILDVSNGGEVLIDSRDGVSPALLIGLGLSDGSSDASGTVTVDGIGSSITLAGTDTSSLGSSGFLAISRFAGTEGTLTISNGGSVVLSGANSFTDLARRDGTTGTVVVDGDGSLFDAGSIISVGADLDVTTFMFTPEIGGDGSLTVQNGGALRVDDLLIVGSSGEFDLDGRIFGGGPDANVEIFGSFEIAGTGFGLARMNHNFIFGGTPSASLSIDIGGVPNGLHDRILTSREASLGDGGVTFNLDNGFLPTAGQEITFVTANGGASLTGETFFVVNDVDNSFEFDVVDNGNNLAFRAITDAVAGTGSVLVGGTADDEALLSAGDDTANGNDGNDNFQGLAGNDLLIGANGNDILSGQTGNDVLDGGRGGDTLLGGAGNDVIKEFTGNDSIDGGDGIDTVDYSALGSTITVDLRRAGPQTISNSGGEDTLTSIENIVGSRGGDRLLGSNGDNTIEGFLGNDRIVGFAGEDTLLGGAANDILAGGDGDDLLIGGLGRDIQSGGAGADTFLFESLADSQTGGVLRDRIQNYEVGIDVFDLSALDADTTTAGDQAFTIRPDTRFTGTAGELRIVETTTRTIVQVDVDGDRSRDFEFEIRGIVALTDADFIL